MIVLNEVTPVVAAKLKLSFNKPTPGALPVACTIKHYQFVMYGLRSKLASSFTQATVFVQVSVFVQARRH
jgi:hypothetical protein